MLTAERGELTSIFWDGRDSDGILVNQEFISVILTWHKDSAGRVLRSALLIKLHCRDLANFNCFGWV